MFMTDFLDESKSASLKLMQKIANVCDGINPVSVKCLVLTGIIFTGPVETLRPIMEPPWV